MIARKRLCHILGAVIVLAAAICADSLGDEPPTATLRVNLKETKAPVSASLYGIFLEEISHAFDGGIYAELIQNRSFEEGVPPPGMKLVKKDDGGLKMELERLPPGVPKDRWDMPWPWSMNCGWDPKRELIGWSLENEGNASAQMKLTEANPMNAASSRSLELTIASGKDSPGGASLVNSGYWGIPVRAKAPYRLQFYLRPGTYRGTVTALLRTKAGKELARHEFGELKPGDSWRKHAAVLTAACDAPDAQFALRFRGQGTLQADWVSLFPPTYKNRPNGLRLDLAKYLEDLKPAFIRYPGGCYVEGLSFQSAPDWRKMVCPPEERPGMWGYWQYRSTDGFGYHEFLEFCEDLGADAMYVAFCGMTVHPENNCPLGEIEPVVQQTLDAIEYALGPTNSKWGSVRAKMGHPKPFPLKYVEIGNEHPPALYGKYYAKFRKAIKDRYPAMTVVMSMYWSGLNWGAIEQAGDAQIDIVDEHAYRPSGWARANFDYFDKYRRKPWKVYLGEYAHHHGSGDWSAAMDDSLFLMMMERNGDLVKMASYAPLLANVNAKSWGVNLIEFDATRSFAHASYYVQKTFNENRPDVNLATSLQVKPKPDPRAPLMAGKFGLGSWHTATEFKELRMYDEQGNLVFSDDFAGLQHWETPGVGQWRAAGGVLAQSKLEASPSMLLLKGPQLRTGRVTLKARRVDGAEGFLMFFNAADIDRFLFCNYGAAGNQFSAIQDRGTPEGCAFHGGKSTPGPIDKGRWHEISLVVGRDKAEMFLDGKLVSDARMERLPSLFATAGYDFKGKTVVLKATNYHAQSVRAEVQLDGAGVVDSTGRHIVIRSDRATDENSLEHSRAIVPKDQPLANCASRFSVILPPLSVSVLRIGATAPALGDQPSVPPALPAATTLPATPSETRMEPRAAREVPLAARPLPLSSVRITGGPLKRSQDLDAQYLLQLEPDRMLAYFRIRAGLKPKAKPYGGWDGDGKNLTGHLAGHYLSAVSLMWAATGDHRFKERADYIVRELKEVQDRHGDGYLGALANGKERFAEVAQGNIRSSGFDLNGLWSPWYVLHKVYAGLRDAYRHAGSRDALELETKFAGWAERVLSKLDEGQAQKMLGTEFGGMNEVLADLYADTGDKRWLALSDRFQHRAIVDPLAERRDILAGTHGNTQVPKLLGSLVRHVYTGNQTDGTAARFFWDRVVGHHSFATGGHGKDEYFGPPDKLSDRVDGRTAETCNVYNMLKMTRQLFALTPDVRYAEFHERALFNHILASIDPQDGRTCYMVPVGRGVAREYQDMFGGFTCCVGTGMESHALHGDGVYYESGDRLWVNLYAPSTAQWKSADAELAMETTFPEGESAALSLTLRAPRRFTLALRRPSWAREGFSVRVNGEATGELPAAGSYVELNRVWRSGDRVALTLPKRLWQEALPDNPHRVALIWGPLVLAGDVGLEQERRMAERPGAPEGWSRVPVFIALGHPAEDWLKPVPGKPGCFRTHGVGRERDVDFMPFYRLHRRPYAVYWDLFTPEGWRLKEAEYAAEDQRRRRIEAATVAYAQPGEMQPERDFNFQGEETEPVRLLNRPGRYGEKWFSFDMPIESDRPMALIVSYHSDERKDRRFEILLDGRRLAEQKLQRTEPARFLDIEYRIPAEWTQGKKKVTVRFQAAPGSAIGAVYGVRMVRVSTEKG